MTRVISRVISCVITCHILHKTKCVIYNAYMARYPRESLNKSCDDSIAQVHNCIAT